MDPASIKFLNESELLEKAEDPEKYYIEVIMQEKIRLYLEKQTSTHIEVRGCLNYNLLSVICYLPNNLSGCSVAHLDDV